MTDRRTWQKREQKIAEDHGVKRNRYSGSASGLSTSDTTHPYLYIESKLRAEPPGWKLFQDTVKKAKKEHKIPVVIMAKKHEQEKIVMMRYSDYMDLAGTNDKWILRDKE